MPRNLAILEFLRDADAGVLGIADVPLDLPRAHRVYKVGGVVDRNIKVCSTRCVVCGTCHPLVVHHVFNWNILKILGMDSTVGDGGLAMRNQFLVMVCPNCHYLVHEKGVHKRGEVNGSRS